MLSQGSQEPFPLGPLCLPLLKLSYATASNDSTAPIPWIHLSSRHNLFLVFETVRGQDSSGQMKNSRIFKVMQDPEIVENIDLDKLAVGAQQALIDIKHPNSRDKMPQIAIIVRAPVIAIRYPLDGGQVRRFQIRFANEEDYYETMKIFSRAKVPTGDAGLVSSRRPNTSLSSASSNVHPTASAPQTVIHPVATTLAVASSSSMVRNPPAQGRNISLAEVSNGPINGGLILPQTTHSDVSGIPPQQQQQNQLMYGSLRACNDSSYLSQTQANPGLQGTKFHGSSISNTNRGSFGQSYDHNPSGAPSTSTSLSPPKPIRSAISVYEPRPSTAPAIRSQHLSQILPPRRDLPFKKPVSDVVSRSISPIKAVDTISSSLPRPDYSEITEDPPKASYGGPPVEDAALQPEVGNIQSSQSTTATGRRKRAPAKKTSRTLAAKKPRTPATKRRSTVGSTKKESTLGNVQETLKSSQTLLQECNASNVTTSMHTKQIGTEYLGTEGVCSASTLGRDTQILQLSSLSMPEEQRSHKVLSFPPPTGQDSTCSKANKVVNPNSSVSHHQGPQPLRELDPNNLSASHYRRSKLDNQDQPENPQAETPRLPETLKDLVSPLQDTYHGQDSQTLVSSLQLLLQDPKFAPKLNLPTSQTDELRPFSDLPEKEKNEALSAYMVQQLKEPGFLDLCKVMNGVWTSYMLL